MKLLVNLAMALTAARLIAADPAAAADTPQPRTGEYTQIAPSADTEIATGFQTSKGLLLYFDFRGPDNNLHNHFYFCPSTSVDTAKVCFMLHSGGASSFAMGGGGVPHLWQKFEEAGGQPSEIQADGDKTELRCPGEQPEPMRRLTAEELSLLNGRILSGEIRMMELPDVAKSVNERDGVQAYKLDEQTTLIIVDSLTHDQPGKTRTRAYVGTKDNMREIGVEHFSGSNSARLGFRGYDLKGLGELDLADSNAPKLNGQPVTRLEQGAVKSEIDRLGFDKIFKHAPLVSMCGPAGPTS